MPLAPALAHARTYGIAFDLLRAQRMKEDLESRAEHVLDEARQAVGNVAFNIDSPRDICRMLQVLNLPMPSKKPGDTVGHYWRLKCSYALLSQVKKYSTAKEHMEPLAKLHAFPAAVLRYRQIDNVLKRNLVVLLRNLRQAGECS